MNRDHGWRKALVLAVATTLGCAGAPEPPPPRPQTNANADGVRRLEQGDLAGAERSFLAALAQAELEDDLTAQAETMNNLGAVRRENGAALEAVAFHRRALALHGADARGEIRTRINLGAAFLGLGRTAEARAEFERVLAASEKVEPAMGKARALAGLAAVLVREAKDLSAALDAARRAARAAREARDDAALAAALTSEGSSLEATGELDAARRAFHEALALDKAHEAWPDVARDLAALAENASRRGERAEAAELLARSARVLRRLGDEALCAQRLGKAAALYRGAGREAEARACEVERDALKVAGRAK